MIKVGGSKEEMTSSLHRLERTGVGRQRSWIKVNDDTWELQRKMSKNDGLVR